MCIRDRIAAAPLLAVEAAREDDPIDRAAVEAALRALEDLHVVGIESVSYTHLDVYKRQDSRRAIARGRGRARRRPNRPRCC